MLAHITFECVVSLHALTKKNMQIFWFCKVKFFVNDAAYLGFVTSLNVINTLIVGRKEDLFTKTLFVVQKSQANGKGLLTTAWSFVCTLKKCCERKIGTGK